MSANLANDSNTSRQIKETSRIVGYTARPTPGEAVSPWQATGTVHHDHLGRPLGGQKKKEKREDLLCLERHQKQAS